MSAFFNESLIRIHVMYNYHCSCGNNTANKSLLTVLYVQALYYCTSHIQLYGHVQQAHMTEYAEVQYTPERCCYITVDSAMAASQNGLCTYKLSIHTKTKIMQIMTKILQFLFI
jgi:hypothetical protein